MINAKSKEKFIKEYCPDEKRATRVRGILNHIGVFEEIFFKEVQYFSAEELRTALFDFSTGNIQTSKNIQVVLKAYILWCYKNEDIPQNVLSNGFNNLWLFDIDANDVIANKLIPNPEYLQDILDSIFDNPENKPVGNIYRMVCWLLYAGVPKEFLGDIKKSDVNLNDYTLEINGIKYQINPLGHSVTKVLCTNNDFYVSQANREYYADSKYPELLLGTIFNKEPHYPAVLGSMMKLIRDTYKKETGKTVDFSATNISLSGAFYEMYNDELDGTLDFEKYFNKWYVNKNPNNYHEKKLQQFETNYKMWKSVFEIK